MNMLPGCQIRIRKRKRTHGFLKRRRSKKGALVIKRRMRKGRKNLTV